MRRLGVAPLRTFSIGFPDAGDSELGYARLVAERFGTAPCLYVDRTYYGTSLRLRRPSDGLVIGNYVMRSPIHETGRASSSDGPKFHPSANAVPSASSLSASARYPRRASRGTMRRTGS